MKTRNSAFYREICILRILVKMGYIDKKALRYISISPTGQMRTTSVGLPSRL